MLLSVQVGLLLTLAVLVNFAQTASLSDVFRNFFFPALGLIFVFLSPFRAISSLMLI
jgi:hypothetical protein